MHKSPASIDGFNTQTLHVQLTTDIDAHCERVRKAGATITMEPATQFYGDRTYRAVDLEGHIWSFGQTVKHMTSDEWDKAMGVKTKLRGLPKRRLYLRTGGRPALIPDTLSSPAILQIGCEKSFAKLGTATRH